MGTQKADKMHVIDIGNIWISRQITPLNDFSTSGFDCHNHRSDTDRVGIEGHGFEDVLQWQVASP
jgi:hypothetical protein